MVHYKKATRPKSTEAIKEETISKEVCLDSERKYCVDESMAGGC